MAYRTSSDIEQEVLSYNGLVTQDYLSTIFNLSLPTIRAIYNRNGVRWEWQRRDQWGENNAQYKNGLGRSTIERLTGRVVVASGRCLYTCERCSDFNKEQEQQRHHKDRDRTNNEAINIEVLCTTCHMKEHNSQRSRDENGRFLD